jgi:RES domain-containing protein
LKTTALAKSIFYRALTPRWAHDPRSGEGAAITGGRFNPVGYAALYLASDPQTAIVEAQQSQLIVPPKTLCAFEISAASIIDFSQGFSGSPQPTQWSMWDCNWRKIWHLERQRPPSWELADDLISDGVAGLLFPSLRNRGGTNLVLFLGNLTGPDEVTVHDPDDDLPMDQSSWRSLP